MTKRFIRLAVVALAAALAVAPATAQQPASWQEITAAVDGVVQASDAREFALCELRAALLWGGYDVRVYVRGDTTKDGKAHFLRIAKGVFSEEVTSEYFGSKASASREGSVSIPSKEAAFEKGVPLFVSDPVLENPKSVKVTFTWNPATTERGPAYPVAESYTSYALVTQSFTSAAAIPFSATPLTRSVSLMIGVDAASKYHRLGFAALRGEYGPTVLSCRVSNDLDLLALTAPPPSLAAAGVLNAASYRGGSVAPGTIMTFFGSRMGPSELTTLRLTADGKKVETVLAGTRVLFDGVATPLVFVRADQSSAVAPYALAGKSSTQIQVEYQGRKSDPITVPVAEAAPGIFTANSSGKGQGAILNEDGSYNSPQRPASPNSIVVIYATGEGAVDPAVEEGKVTAPPLSKPKLPVSVKIGGLEAEVLYAGPAPGLVAGVLQVNARINAAVAAGDAVSVLITVGTFTSQPDVTVAVR
jgi:uncharacterized protein (TIGR03437 family)